MEIDNETIFPARFFRFFPEKFLIFFQLIKIFSADISPTIICPTYPLSGVTPKTGLPFIPAYKTLWKKGDPYRPAI